MITKKRNPFIVPVSLFIVSIFVFTAFYVSDSIAAEREKIDKAIALYQHEDYEEALEILKSLRAEFPQSSTAAYYLGLTYKKMQDLAKARPDLEAAVTLKPKIDNAVPELIDTLYQIGDIDEAKRWIEVAEKEGPPSARLELLKGLTLLKEKKDLEKSIAAFDKAQKLDESLATTVKYYKGLAYLQMKKLDEAKDVFREVVVRDSSSTLAAYANEYVDAIARDKKATAPFRGNIGLAMQYDNNVVLMPVDDTSQNISDKGDWRHAYTGQLEYNYKPSEHFGAKAGYSFYYGKQFELGFYDMMINDISVQPAFYMDKVMVSFPVQYTNMGINSKLYLNMIGIGNTDNIMLDSRNMAQLTFMHKRKYFDWPVTRDNDNRDAREYIWSVGWYYFFAKNYEGFVAVRYMMNYDDTKGKNWTYLGNRMSVTSTIPVSKKIKWSVSTEYFRQDFVKTNSSYEKHRTDDIITVSSLAAINIFTNCELQLQYTYVNDAATIGVYKYNRGIYSAGLKYEF